MMKPFADLYEGLIQGMSAVKYHGIEAFSSTLGREIVKSSPRHARARQHRPQTPAMVLGSAVHAGVLEPRATGVCIAPDVDRRTTAGKQAYAAFVSQADGIILTPEQGELYRGMVDAVAESRAASGLLRICLDRELSGFTLDPETLVLVKCRFDAISQVDGIILDIKTTSGLATRAEFERAIGGFGYGFQAALYQWVAARLGVPSPSFVFVVVETEPPHGVGVFALQQEAIDLYQPRVREAMQLYAECMKANAWRSYPDEVQSIGIPAWVRKGLEEVAA